jgi:TatD DNase family protein
VIDFHCHLDLYPDPQGLVQQCASRGIYVLSVTTTPSAWKGTSALAAGLPRIRTALGLHPQIAHERKNELGLFEQTLSESRYVGEVGLDGSPEFKRYWTDQVTVFRRILEACKAAGGRILSIHSRRASSAVLDHLDQNRTAGTFILHWFSGTRGELARAIELGCWFSVGPAMLAGQRGRELVARMPRDRVLTESDGPFAQIDGRAAQPWDVERAVDYLATLWQLTPDEVTAKLLSNFSTLVTQT